MKDSEKLRETLIDLERSRRAERESRIQTEGLLEGLELLGSMEASDEMFGKLLKILRELLEFEEAFVLSGSSFEEMEPVAVTEGIDSGLIWRGAELTRRALNEEPIAVFNVALIPEWKQLKDLGEATVRSALHIGLRDEPNTKSLLVCTHEEPGFFSPEHVKLARRFSMLATQALINRDLRELKLQAFQRSVRDQFFRGSRDLMCVVDLDGTLLQANPSMIDSLGLDSETLAEQSFLELVDSTDHSTVEELFEGLVTQGQPISFEAPFSDIDDQRRWLQWNMSLSPDGDLVYGAARDITERRDAERRRRQLNEELRTARDEALQANQAKSTFLANMSHELRTPLNAVIGYSEMLIEDLEVTGSDHHVRDLERIRIAGRHLLSIIKNVLDLSKIEAERMQVNIRPLVLKELVDDVVSMTRPMMTQNRNQFELEFPDRDISMTTDESKLRQILFNLLSNAAKFTEDGTVRLSVFVDDQGDGSEHLVFCVEDTGVGMSEKQRTGIFKAFAQGDQSTTREFDGSGLGLAITDHFCSLLGGSIDVDSTLGEGSIFRVRLPRVLSEEDRDASSSFSSLAAHVERQSSISHSSIESANDDGEARRKSNLILIVDDDQDFQSLMKRVCEGHGYNVATATTGAQGLHRAWELDPMAILLDINLPLMDGWTVLENLKAHPEMKQIPVIVITMVDDRRRAIELGAREFMLKPIDRDQLMGILESG